MNKDKLSGTVEQVKGEAKEQWGRLTDDDSKVVDGKLDKAKGKVKERVGEVKDKLSK
ncbi:CsbD family protein [Bacillus sp. sid0103]|uniref:CsbD family protein n=1 Tax=Bacillaceae TaxID=186817 RepID=UPI001C47DB03|nr:CsbD family protein [Bacillus sp. sid0103]MBV7505216.1 CsbD family protein [Bacillus sp. sid0103]